MPNTDQSTEAVREYASVLRDLVGRRHFAPSDEQAAIHALNGEAAAVVRRVVSLAMRRSLGAFFTSSSMARLLVAPHADAIRDGARVLDPACGAGDLLIAASDHLRDARAATWQRQLAGVEIVEDLLQLATERLKLNRRVHGMATRNDAPAATLTAADFFATPPRLVERADVILLNPPYSMTPAPADWEHGEGAISKAALFLSTVIERARTGAEIAAILPDVLRSGSRYERWRAATARSCGIIEIRRAGQFDAWTDVDVFILRLRVGTPAADVWPTPNASRQSVGSYFDVTVGPVVPHRHPELGPKHPFLHARSLGSGSVIDVVRERRGFTGTLIAPPFVAIRRTSRPGDRGRRLATIVVGHDPVAVENHIICARPKDGTERSCEELLQRLKHPDVLAWLDERIRCRHLTVKAIKEIEWITIPPLSACESIATKPPSRS